MKGSETSPRNKQNDKTHQINKQGFTNWKSRSTELMIIPASVELSRIASEPPRAAVDSPIAPTGTKLPTGIAAARDSVVATRRQRPTRESVAPVAKVGRRRRRGGSEAELVRVVREHGEAARSEKFWHAIPAGGPSARILLQPWYESIWQFKNLIELNK